MPAGERARSSAGLGPVAPSAGPAIDAPCPAMRHASELSWKAGRAHKSHLPPPPFHSQQQGVSFGKGVCQRPHGGAHRHRGHHRPAWCRPARRQLQAVDGTHPRRHRRAGGWLAAARHRHHHLLHGCDGACGRRAVPFVGRDSSLERPQRHKPGEALAASGRVVVLPASRRLPCPPHKIGAATTGDPGMTTTPPAPGNPTHSLHPHAARCIQDTTMSFPSWMQRSLAWTAAGWLPCSRTLSSHALPRRWPSRACASRRCPIARWRPRPDGSRAACRAGHSRCRRARCGGFGGERKYWGLCMAFE